MTNAENQDKVHKDIIAAVLNSYAHGATTEQAVTSAGVDYDTAYKIIADAIAAQK